MTLQLRILILCIITGFLHGCATIDTITEAKPGSPKFFSGTRLDLHALSEKSMTTTKFTVDPPEYPLLDLPASFIANLFISPFTGAIAIFEELNE